MENRESGFYVRSLPYAEFLERISSLAVEVFGDSQVHLSVGTPVPGLHVSLDGPARSLSSRPEVTNAISAYRPLPLVVAKTAQLSFGDQKIAYRLEGVGGRFDLQLNSAEKIQAALSALQDTFNALSYSAHVLSTLDEDTRAGLALRDKTLSELEAATARTNQFLIEMGVREAERSSALRESLESEYRTLKARLESEHAERASTAEKVDRERREKLDADREAHRVEVEKFETQEARRMRRQLLARIEQVVAGVRNFSVQDKTSEKRLIVHIVACALILLALLGAIALGYTICTKSPPNLVLLAPFTAMTVTFVTTAIYYLRWNDRWFRQHADSEFAASQYHADMLRASWVAELVSELQEQADQPLPAELLSAFTRHLFRAPGQNAEGEHPLESLTTLVKRVRSISVGNRAITIQGDPTETPPVKRKLEKRALKVADASHE